jgi:hypothetical protein
VPLILPMPAHAVIHIHPAAAPKPAQGEPCNGCGVCCIAEPCPVGMVVSGRRTGECAALAWVDDEHRYRCGVVSQPRRFLPRGLAWLAPLAGRIALRFIAAGKGCDCSLAVEQPG